ncbi:bcl-2 homologous antagonist/killer isoform X1 [Sarcophilus harrisii]|uniref:Bcl-2 homologous antagonist/killer n=1 Tax=Sarcophilus harrisii TaxID=9305 RepID=A0A7N4NH60_SARHA|nr:bcl-2 homologous antagonist/killer isoform X1 [Sarcophilus harrisii]
MASRQVSRVRAPSSTAEEQVALQTEEVFRSYVFYRHQQEQESEGDAVLADPEMDTLPQELSSTTEQVGRQLAIIGDNIIRRYNSEFEAMLQHLQPTPETAYESFVKIASSLFESGINWGRVVALLGFGYRLALYVYRRGLTGFLGHVARFVADFMLQHFVTRWIAQNGGWVAALDLSNNSIWMKRTALCFCGRAAGRWSLQASRHLSYLRAGGTGPLP